MIHKIRNKVFGQDSARVHHPRNITLSTAAAATTHHSATILKTPHPHNWSQPQILGASLVAPPTATHKPSLKTLHVHENNQLNIKLQIIQHSLFYY